MNRIILSGQRDIKTDEIIKPDTDYGIFLVASRISEEKMDSHDEFGTDEYKYRMKIVNLESIMDIREKKEVKIQSGQTKSQKLRWIVEQNLGEYEPFMDWLISRADELCDEFRELNIK